MRNKGNNKNLIPIKKGEKKTEKPFDKRQFEALCRIHCTEKEICDILGFKTHDTLNTKLKAEYGDTFENVLPLFASQGKASLRRMQWKGAEEGSIAMQIWLGKQMLGQADKQEIETSQNHKIEFTRNIVHRSIDSGMDK